MHFCLYSVDLRDLHRTLSTLKTVNYRRLWWARYLYGITDAHSTNWWTTHL